MENCPLCGAMDGELGGTAHWRVVLNWNQDRLGKCFLVLDRHEEDVCNLSPEERDDLWLCLRAVQSAIAACFRPEHFNYMFLMNQDAHTHLHVVPRYRTPRAFAGVAFPVVDTLDGGNVRLPPGAFAELASVIRAQLAPQLNAATT